MRIIIVLIFLSFTTASFAETYKWEDAEGMHFTENANSIPKKYRAKALAEARGDIIGEKPSSHQEVTPSSQPTKTAPKIPTFEEWKATIPGSNRMDNGALLQEYNKRVVPNEIYRSTGNSKPLENARQQDIEDKLDRIDRKLRQRGY